jgi:hypothetical protein
MPEMDLGSNSDIFFQMEYAGNKYKTQTVEQKFKATAINQTWKIPVEWPPQSNNLVIRCLDEDPMSSFELIGTIILKLDVLD